MLIDAPLTFHLGEERKFDPLSPKGERFLIHSSQLKGSSNRLLPANPAASLERHGYGNEEEELDARAIRPRAKAQGFLAKKDKF